MSKIMFIMIPEKGHINPYIGVAGRLKEIGHELSFYSMGDISPQLNRAGLDGFIGEFPEQQDTPDQSDAPKAPSSGSEFAEKVRDRDWLRNWIKTLLVDNAPELVEKIGKQIRAIQPDLIVTDPMVYPAAISAQREGKKWVAVSNSLNPVLPPDIHSDLLETVDWLAPDRKKLFQNYGLNVSFRGCDMLSPDLNIAFTTPEFAGTDFPNIELVGPSIPKQTRGDEQSFPWEKLQNETPIIYMSFGSQIYYQPRMFRTVFEAVRNKPVQLVASVNELLGTEELGKLPANVLATHYTPQLEILARSAAMITHGGANSVMEALYFGVPLLISPICNDQFHQVHFIEKQGVGKTLDLETCTPEECWNVLEELLKGPAINKNLERISHSYQRDGALRAAQLIEELAGGEAP